MQNGVHRAGHINVARDVGPREPEPRVVRQVGNVGLDAGDQIVHRQDVPALGDEPVAQMRTKKPGSACNHRAHAQISQKTGSIVACPAAIDYTGCICQAFLGRCATPLAT